MYIGIFIITDRIEQMANSNYNKQIQIHQIQKDTPTTCTTVIPDETTAKTATIAKRTYYNNYRNYIRIVVDFT